MNRGVSSTGGPGGGRRVQDGRAVAGRGRGGRVAPRRARAAGGQGQGEALRRAQELQRDPEGALLQETLGELYCLYVTFGALGESRLLLYKYNECA